MKSVAFHGGLQDDPSCSQGGTPSVSVDPDFGSYPTVVVCMRFCGFHMGRINSICCFEYMISAWCVCFNCPLVS